MFPEMEKAALTAGPREETACLKKMTGSVSSLGEGKMKLRDRRRKLGRGEEAEISTVSPQAPVTISSSQLLPGFILRGTFSKQH